MTQRVSDTKPVREFIDVVTKYVHLIDSRNKLSGIKILQQSFILLPQMCLCGMKLPDIHRMSDYELPKKDVKEFFEIYNSIQSKIKRNDVYHQVFDPFNTDDIQLTSISISNDLSEVYQDINQGLREWESASADDRRRIIWDWKFGFENHWGNHATSAFKALYWLLYSHIEDNEGDYIGIRNDEK